MRFLMPNYPCDFVLPNEWLTEAGMIAFAPTTPSYKSTWSAVLAALRDVEPPYRRLNVPKNWRGFDRGRLVRILQGIASGAEIEPVPVVELPDSGVPAAPYRFRVCDGFHRFYASIAAGFESLPVVISAAP